MAAIGKVSVAFTASTGNLQAGVQAAARAFKSLGGDAGALQTALAGLRSVGSQTLAGAGPAAEAAARAFQQAEERAAALSAQLRDGKISADQFREAMGALVERAAEQASLFKEGAALTKQYESAQDKHAATVARLTTMWGQGAINLDTLNAATADAAKTLAEADGSAAAARAAQQALDAQRARGADIVKSMQTAEERYAATMKELGDLLFARAVDSETYARAQRAAAAALAESNGSAERARAAESALNAQRQRAADIVASVQTAEERYAATMRELNDLRSRGLITTETLTRAEQAAANTLAENNGTREAARAAEQALTAQRQQAAAVVESVQTAEERYSARLTQLNALLASNAISQETFNRAQAAAASALEQANNSTEEARAAQQALADQQRRAASVTRSVQTAQERYRAEVNDLNALLRAGAITQETYNRAVKQASERMREVDTSSNQMMSALNGIKGRLTALIAIDVAGFFSRIVSSISNSISQLVAFGRAEAQVVDRGAALATRLGMTYGEFAGLAHAAAGANVSMEQLGGASQRLELTFAKAAQAPGAARQAFVNLGLSIEQLNGMNASDRFKAIGEAIAALPTEAERAQAAIQIFGRSGAELLPLFNQGAGAISAAAAEADRFGLALNNAQAADIKGMNDAFTNAYEAIRGVVQQIVARLAPAVRAVTEAFTTLISGVGGKEIGEAIGEAILDGARYFAGVADFFIANVPKVWQYVLDVVKPWLGVWNAGQRVADFFRGVGNVLTAAFKTVASVLTQVMGLVLQGIGKLVSAIPGWGGVSDQLKAAGTSLRQSSSQLFKEAGQAANAAGQNFRDAVNGRAQEAGQAIAGPVLTALDAAIARQRESAAAVDAATKPVEIKQKVEVIAKQATQGIDSRSAEGVKEYLRILRGDTGNDVQQQQLDAQNRIADGIDRLIDETGVVETDIAS